MIKSKIPPIEIRMMVLGAIEYADGASINERIRNTAKRVFKDQHTGAQYRFTWRTISTWYYRYKASGVKSIDNKTRKDKNVYRKIQPNELAEAINEVLPTLSKNKSKVIPKSVIYQLILEKGLCHRSQLSQTSFYRMTRENNLLAVNTTEKLRLSFAMQYANELWQADTLYGPAIKQADGSFRKTFFIAFIDDASRVITHGEFFYADNADNMINAFRSALYKRGRPERLYFDNGSNYTSKEILQACLRLNIILSHAPIRDGSAKGKIERFFRGFRDRFLTRHLGFNSLEDLNEKAQSWIENSYNSQYHSGIQMIPIDRFNLDLSRIKFLTDDEYSEEVFFVEEERKVSKTNVFSINSMRFECSVDLREQKIQVRYDRVRKNRFIVYYRDQRMGEALPLNLIQNANQIRKKSRRGKP